MSCILLFLLSLSTEHHCGCLESAAVADTVFATRHNSGVVASQRAALVPYSTKAWLPRCLT